MKQRSIDDFKRLRGLGAPGKFSSKADVKRFREWLRFVLHPSGEMGFLTARFYKKYVEMGPHKTEQFAIMYDLARSMSYNDTTVILNAMHPEKVRSLPICWVYTEHLESSLEECLHKWENSREGKVKWGNFGKAKKKKAMVTEHMPCPFYYDEETVALVRKADSSIFEAFGYDTCCSRRPKKRSPPEDTSIAEALAEVRVGPGSEEV